jgi:hypothetical protein
MLVLHWLDKVAMVELGQARALVLLLVEVVAVPVVPVVLRQLPQGVLVV